jgi:hypothetical protein
MILTRAKAILSGNSQRTLFHRCSAASRAATGMSANLRTYGNWPETQRRPHSSSVPTRVLSTHSTTHASVTASRMHRVTISSATFQKLLHVRHRSNCFLLKKGLTTQLSVVTSSSHESEKTVQILASTRKAKKNGRSTTSEVVPSRFINQVV